MPAHSATDTSHTVIIAIMGTHTSRRTETHPGKPGAQTPLSFLRGVRYRDYLWVGSGYETILRISIPQGGSRAYVDVVAVSL